MVYIYPDCFPRLSFTDNVGIHFDLPEMERRRRPHSILNLKYLTLPITSGVGILIATTINEPTSRKEKEHRFVVYDTVPVGSDELKS